MTEQVFQPFTDRLSRDIRNALSSSLVDALQSRSLDPVQATADSFLKSDPPEIYRDYILQRMRRYRRVIDNLGESTIDPLYASFLLWDQQLFFEVHEVLEHEWLKAEGEEKLFLQAIIRAAGVYIKLGAGYGKPAARIAAKALVVLETNRERLAEYFPPEKLIEPLKELSQTPPRLLE